MFSLRRPADAQARRRLRLPRPHYLWTFESTYTRRSTVGDRAFPVAADRL